MPLPGIEWDEEKNTINKVVHLLKNKRLISARLATKAERRAYNGYYQIDGSGWNKAT